MGSWVMALSSLAIGLVSLWIVMEQRGSENAQVQLLDAQVTKLEMSAKSGQTETLPVQPEVPRLQSTLKTEPTADVLSDAALPATAPRIAWHPQDVQ